MDLCVNENTTVLVGLAQGGSREALEFLFARYLPRVRQIVSLRLGYRVADMYAIEDYVQDALLNVFRKIDRFDVAAESRFRDWVAACVANTVRDGLRRTRRKASSGSLPSYPYPSDGLLSSVLAGSESDPEESAVAVETAERIEAELLVMSEAEREVIILSRLCGMTSAEIAEKTGINETTARKRLSRALQHLERAHPRG